MFVRRLSIERIDLAGERHPCPIIAGSFTELAPRSCSPPLNAIPATT